MQDLDARYRAAQDIARRAGVLALGYFRRWRELDVDSKGHQDFVSEGDRAVETFVRAELTRAFPDDAIIGEEEGVRPGTTGLTWVIDPIDGTSNFINGIPQWCVIIAVCSADAIEIGVIHEPVMDQLFHARRGHGSFCNADPIRCTRRACLGDGPLGIGYSGRVPVPNLHRLIAAIDGAGGVFWRNGSGGLSLAYVAAGSLLGYCEEHMNSWDFLAGYLLVTEAGGRAEALDIAQALTKGARVVLGGPEVFDQIEALAVQAFGAMV